MLRAFNNLIYTTAVYVVAPLALIVLWIFVLLYALFSGKKRERPRLVWGPIPIISNKYWSNALNKAGYQSQTLMFAFFSSINKQDDFDVNIYSLVNLHWGPLQRLFNHVISPYLAFIYAVARFDIFHHSFHGGFIGKTPLWRSESYLLKFAGKRIIITPFGEDAYLYSRLIDPSLRHVLLSYMKRRALVEVRVQKRVNYWTKNADIIIAGFMIDGIGRWDLLPFQPVVIDTALWKSRQVYSETDGRNGVVKIIHTPNSRNFKGTEFLLQAMEELRAEGLKIELILVEGKQNEEVRLLMAEEADILAEQFIATAYAMSGIEGMASGVATLANLELEDYTRLFRRYSYLNECPILSTTPETLKENLRVLITNPHLREELGRAGRRYVEKYHSEATAQYMFGSIYDKIWAGKEVDLINLFHPLISEYNRCNQPVKHPLIENRLPASYFTDAETSVS